MKRFKKITALLLALLMCFSMMAATLTAAGYFEGHISYNGNSNSGGTNPANTTFTLQTVNSVTDFWAKVSGPGSLTKTGYTFSGWNTNAAGTGTSYSVDQWVACQRTGIFHNYFNVLNLYA
jgi:hypothetical protein